MWIRPRNYSTACAPRAIVLCSVGSLTFNPSHFRTRRRVHGNSAPRPWIRHVRAWPPTTHPRHQRGGYRRDRRAVWRVPSGPQGLAGLRADAPSHRLAARTASGRAGPTAPRTPATQPQPRCLRAAAGPGRASRSTTPSRRLACGDLAGGPPPSGTKTGSPGQESTANPGGERAGPTAPGTSATQPRPRRYKTRARHSTEYRAPGRL